MAQPDSRALPVSLAKAQAGVTDGVELEAAHDRSGDAADRTRLSSPWSSPVRRILHSVGENVNWFLRCLQPRLLLIELIVRVIPDYYAYGFRARLYRSAGCDFEPGVEIHGRLNLYGTVRNKAGNLRMASGANVAPFCTFGVDGRITLGHNVGLAPFVKIFTTQHELGPAHQRSTFKVQVRPVVVEDGAVVMTTATILPGVTVGRGAIVGAGAVVTKDVAPNTFVGGVPARVIRELPEGPITAGIEG
jgi:maltose O-acetyltransferase